MRILVVEDYEPIRLAVVRELIDQEFSVDQTDNGADAVAMAQSSDYDVIVLDLNIPRIGGLDVVRQLRDNDVQSQILILSGRGGLKDRIAGLDCGADDYVVKPFEIDELLARVRALIRRAYTSRDPVISVGHVEINTTDKSVRVAGDVILLTAKEYALLEFLAFRQGEVVSRSEIWQHVYDDTSTASSNVVDVYVGYLRKKIERAPHPRLLHTRRGRGYLLAPLH
ncbi:MAG: response regulator transcription factor [Planctomycetota bacterium]